MEGLAGFELVAVDLGDETTRGAARWSRGYAGRRSGGPRRRLCCRERKPSRPVEELAELGDVGGDLGAEGGEVGGGRFAGATGLVGDVGAELGELGTEVMVECLGASVETGELPGEGVG